MTFTSQPSLAERKPFGLWHYVYKLLRLRLVIFWSGLRRARTRRKISMAILGLAILALAVFLFWISTVVLNLLQSPRVLQYIDLRQIIASMPSTIISLAFLLFLLSNFGVLLQVLYLSNDMDFLLAAPLPIRAVFLAKLLQGLLPNFALVSLFALPLLFGLGVLQNYNFLFYPLVVITLAAVSLLGAGIASLLVMTIVRVVPARRVAEILGFFGAVVSLLFSQSGQLFARFGTTSRELTGAISQIAQMDQPWSPLSWAGRGLVALGENNLLVALPLLLLSLGLAGGLFWGSLSLAERLYYSGWARMQESPRKKKVRQPAAAAVELPAEGKPAWNLFGVIPTPVRAIVSKDWRLLRRDLRNLSQLIAPLILSGIYAFSTVRGFQSIHPVPGDIFSTILSRSSTFLSLGLPMFFGWTFMLNLTINAFSREGKNYWILKTAPLTSQRLMVAKFIASYLPSLIFQWLLFGLVLALGWPGLQNALYALLVAVPYIAGLIGINLAFGAYGARLDWEDPRRMNRGATGCVGSLAGLVYVLLAWVLFFLPPAAIPMFGLPEWLGQVLGLAMGGAVSLAFATLAPRLALPRVEQIGLN
jgi:ABC-2 type transport system permease protein